jgi:alkylation response protein AidB-like acyl-CoA dehydrogenase
MISEDVQSSIDMIRESARGIVSHGDLSRVRTLRFTDPGFNRAVWGEICDMGWPALRLPEDKGGVGLGLLPYCALAEEVGRGLMPEPLVPGALAAALLDGDTLAAQLAGDTLVLPAWQDSRDAIGPERPLGAEGDKVSATKLYVPVAGGADAFLVIGTDGAALVQADAEGVTIAAEKAQDGTTLARVTFDKAQGKVIAADPRPAFAEAALATAAYLLGLMDSALDMTVAYLKERVQFGRPIGTFQVLQHMAVDLKLELEVSRASVEDAAQMWDRDGPAPETYAAISRAKARATQSALRLTRETIQLHGGIGFTDEHDIGLYLRKAIVMAAQYGSAECHRRAYAVLKPIEEEV